MDMAPKAIRCCAVSYACPLLLSQQHLRILKSALYVRPILLCSYRIAKVFRLYKLSIRLSAIIFHSLFVSRPDVSIHAHGNKQLSYVRRLIISARSCASCLPL
jgi:hypothetical protein